MGCVFMRGVLAKRPPVITLLHHPPRQPYNSSLLSDTPSILLFLALLFSVSLFLSLSLPLSDTHAYTHKLTHAIAFVQIFALPRLICVSVLGVLVCICVCV